MAKESERVLEIAMIMVSIASIFATISWISSGREVKQVITRRSLSV